MSDHISLKLNRVIHQQARLGIMSILMVTEKVDFNYLKSQLKLTDGNLSSHLSLLEDHKLIKITKTFVKKKPRTLCQVTAAGRSAFLTYMNDLEKIIHTIPSDKKG
jgi:hypothetical protein